MSFSWYRQTSLLIVFQYLDAAAGILFRNVAKARYLAGPLAFTPFLKDRRLLVTEFHGANAELGAE